MFGNDEALPRLFELAAGVHHAAKRRVEASLRSLDMTYPQYGALLVLAREGPLKQGCLAELLDTDRTTMMVICDSLERRGWAKRSADPEDRRSKIVGMLPDGQAAFETAKALVAPVYALASALFADEEARIALIPLEKLWTGLLAAPDSDGGSKGGNRRASPPADSAGGKS